MTAPESQQAVLPRRRDLPSRRVGGELMLRDPDAGTVHFLNPTAAAVWESCDGKTTVEECAARLRQRFSVSAAVNLAADIQAVLTDLVAKGLVDG